MSGILSLQCKKVTTEVSKRRNSGEHCNPFGEEPWPCLCNLSRGNPSVLGKVRHPDASIFNITLYKIKNFSGRRQKSSCLCHLWVESTCESVEITAKMGLGWSCRVNEMEAVSHLCELVSELLSRNASASTVSIYWGLLKGFLVVYPFAS